MLRMSPVLLDVSRARYTACMGLGASSTAGWLLLWLWLYGSGSWTLAGYWYMLVCVQALSKVYA